MGKNDRELSAHVQTVKSSISPDRYPPRSFPKLDKIKRSQIQKNVKAIREGLNVQPGTTIIPFSAETKQGRDEIWELIDSFVLPQEEK